MKSIQTARPTNPPRKTWLILTPCLLLMMLLSSIFAFQPGITAQAQTAPDLSVSPITWNIVTLDETNVANGPQLYLAGVSVCNADGAGAANNLFVSFTWLETNNQIQLVSDATQTLSVLAANTCQDFYFQVSVVRETASIDSSREFRITATSGQESATHAFPLEIYVQGAATSNNLTVDSFTVPTTANVGDEVQLVLQGTLSGAEGFGVLLHSLEIPWNILRLNSVEVTYTTQSVINNEIWWNACDWQIDPTLPPGEYNTCQDTAILTGSFTATFYVDVVGAGSAQITPVIAGLQGTGGTTFLYNSDYGADAKTLTVQQSATPTATSTGTQVATSTATATGTTTGVTATATATGSITPAPNATKSVSPASAGIGSYLTFTIRVGNSGTAPALNVVVTDNFSSYAYLNVDDVTTTQGTDNINGRLVTVNIGTLMPKQTVTVTIRVRVNNTATGTQNPCNTATISFTGGTRTSNQMCFRVTGGSSLPGTGQNPSPAEPTDNRTSLIIFGAILGFGALLALRLALWAWKNQRAALRWYLGIGLTLTAAAAVLVSCSMRGDGTGELEISSDVQSGFVDAEATATPTINPLAIMPAYMFATPGPVETLPVYAVPTPVLEPEATALPESDSNIPDTSNIERIIIPTLGVDNVVAYVPYDGQTWMIQGLRQEVAWLGDTSWPGLGGNTGLAGHVTVSGEGNGPFRYIMDLVQGDTIEVYTENYIYTYAVRQKLVLEETDLSVLEQTDNSQITLITCVDWDESLGMYLKRLAVVADLVDAERITLRGQ